MLTYLQDLIASLGGPVVLTLASVGLLATVLWFLFKEFWLWLGGLLQEVFGRMWFIFMWLFPPILTAIAWSLPGLTGPLNQVNWASFAIVVVTGALWVVLVQIPTANNPSTSLQTLKADFYVSLGWTTVLLLLLGSEKGNVQMWVLMPTVISWIDLCTGTRAAFNNAFSKNPTQIQTMDRG